MSFKRPPFPFLATFQCPPSFESSTVILLPKCALMRLDGMSFEKDRERSLYIKAHRSPNDLPELARKYPTVIGRTTRLSSKQRHSSQYRSPNSSVSPLSGGLVRDATAVERQLGVVEVQCHLSWDFHAERAMLILSILTLDKQAFPG